MGNLTPNAKYIYETPDGGKTIYAREEGSDKRELVGYHDNSSFYPYDREDDVLWRKIRESAKVNPALQQALEQCKMLYYLGEKEEPMLWHPV